MRTEPDRSPPAMPGRDPTPTPRARIRHVLLPAVPGLAAVPIVVALSIAAAPSSLVAQQPAELELPDEEIVVGMRVVPPFVIETPEGGYEGLTVELWEHLALELGIDFRFEERDLEGLLTGVEDGSLFASAAALTVTSEREARVDFTHPFLVTGLGIAVPYEPVGLGGAISALFSPRFLWVVFLLALLLLFWGALVWLFERRANPEEFGGSPAHGLGSGFWWAAVTMTTVGYGDKAPRTVGGRVVGFVWMFAAIIVISFFTASIASSLTVNRLASPVSGPEDLPSVRVGSLANSAALGFLDSEGVGATAFESIEEGLAAVSDGTIDAFVHDAPILRHYSRESFPGAVRVLPGTFREQYYGIALPRGSEARNEINRVLLDYLAGDEWARLTRRYLGEG